MTAFGDDDIRCRSVRDGGDRPGGPFDSIDHPGAHVRFERPDGPAQDRLVCTLPYFNA
ncbi:hypothetical protein [Bradyrhizobium manausense]|uniref:hypothetical protein n=1 Tax=Bradyrhizobium manausense TaxID=989370 RepID=UPI001BAA48F4|nr:hypothetical protein [Bradyrhizobium manausense]MBR0721361.1 hypothetical protein [Bradyrhizobium manausense]